MDISLLKKTVIAFSLFSILIALGNYSYADETKTVASIDETSIEDESEEVVLPESEDEETSFIDEEDSSEI
ncbi:hypothetical protein N9N67_10470 [Bacteriovoracaceae bacterium]|nr:hypothetical protein [Bacteriovoracaceae bacterium]